MSQAATLASHPADLVDVWVVGEVGTDVIAMAAVILDCNRYGCIAPLCCYVVSTIVCIHNDAFTKYRYCFGALSNCYNNSQFWFI